MADKTRTRKMTFRLTEDELEQVKHLVTESGTSQQKYLLYCALNKHIINTNGFRALIPEVKRIGANVNQIAKKANQTDYVSEKSMEEVREEVKKIWQLLKQLTPTAT